MATTPVRIVVDSTADVPHDVAADLGIGIVPLTVRFGTDVFRDRVDLSLAAFMARLTASDILPATAQPSPGDFLTAYAPLVAAGVSIVSLHLSSKLSGTYSSALVAAREATITPGQIEVVDSQTIAMACGLVAIEAARAARDGADQATVLALVNDLIGRTHLVAALDTLDFAFRGGRISRAQAVVGSLLSIKPIITVADGAVTRLEQVRTRQKSLQRLQERLEALHQERQVIRLSFLHVADLESALDLRERVRSSVPVEPVLITELGPVVATYTGPRGVGFAALTAR
ncbi:MAG: DegV family protein [Chloroflexi bacterium]|nr:DegV family protein [Chloroflexota bacterium]